MNLWALRSSTQNDAFVPVIHSQAARGHVGRIEKYRFRADPPAWLVRINCDIYAGARPMTVTPIYAALLAFLFIALSARAIRARRTARVAIGDGGDAVLVRAMRVQANFAEYAPLALLLIGFCELQAAPAWLLHVLGLLLLAGRTIHAFGLAQTRENFRLRVTGMSLTLTAIGAAALVNLVLAAL